MSLPTCADMFDSIFISVGVANPNATDFDSTFLSESVSYITLYYVYAVASFCIGLGNCIVYDAV